MPLSIVSNNITKICTEFLVNTANELPVVGPGCDWAIYQAAGYDELLAYRKEKIGVVPEGEVFLTPAFGLPCRYLIHAVSPFYLGGNHGEEEKLRNCYRKSLELAREKQGRSIAFPLIATGCFGYPKEEGLRIAVDEINRFLLKHDMEVTLVLFEKEAVKLGTRIFPDMQSYIDEHYVETELEKEYGSASRPLHVRESARRRSFLTGLHQPAREGIAEVAPMIEAPGTSDHKEKNVMFFYEDGHSERLKERIAHRSDTFSQYLMHLISLHGLKNVNVYHDAGLDKKIFSKIKNHTDYHPRKETALCLCIGARLNLDESRDLLARAGYALSPCSMTDVIFQYFIEHEIYDIFELDNQLEEYGLQSLLD